MDIITIIWYLSTFLALSAFVFLMACSNRKCGGSRNSRPRNFQRQQDDQNYQQSLPTTPAPSYSEFAPPSYESVMMNKSFHSNKSLPNKIYNNSNNNNSDIYVITIHSCNNNNDNCINGINNDNAIICQQQGNSEILQANNDKNDSCTAKTSSSSSLNTSRPGTTTTTNIHTINAFQKYFI